MHRCVTQLYYRLFYFLEEKGVLDPMNELHSFALHHVFLGRINKSLTAFKDGWNMHGLRTERNHTPVQLFQAGALQLKNSGLEAMDLFDAVEDDYGIDAPSIIDMHAHRVWRYQPVTRLNISEQDFEHLCTSVPVAMETDDYGIALYEQTVAFLQNDCPSYI